MKSKSLVFTTMVLSLLIVFSAVSFAFSSVPVKSITLNKTSVTLNVGKTFTLTAVISPKNATNKAITWSTSNSSIAKVSTKGVVTAIKEGKATITAKSVNGKTAKCSLTITLLKPTVITMALSEIAAYPYNKNGELFKIVEQKCNVKLKAEIIPEASYAEKSSIMMATAEFPDLMYLATNKMNQLKYANEGLLMPLDDLINNYAPNIKRWFPAEQKIKIQNNDRKMYVLPQVYTDKLFYLGWLAREDIMKEVGIKKDPETTDEFYSMLKAIKAKYPDKYPIAIRMPAMMVFMSSWGFDEGSWGISYRNGTYVFGGTGNEDKECVQFIKKLYDEKLLDPEFSVTSAAQWEEKMTNSKSYVTWDYMTRCEFFNNAVNKTDPKFNLKVIPLPKPNANAKPNSWVPDTVNTDSSFVINAKSKVAVAAIKVMDFMYSNEGIDLTNWGVVGKTYTKKGNVKQYLPQVKTAVNPNGTLDIQKDYNVMSSFRTVIDIDAYNAFMLGKNSAAGAVLYKQKNFARPIAPAIDSFITKEGSDKISEIAASLYPARDSNIMKFIMGQRPLSEWDKYIEELKALKMDDYVKIYQDAYSKWLNQ